jgi:hypothetical protein
LAVIDNFGQFPIDLKPLEVKLFEKFVELFQVADVVSTKYVEVAPLQQCGQ